MLQAADRISTLFSRPSIKSYAFDDNPVRIINRNGEPWFFAVDVCEVLSLSNVSQAVSRLDDDEKCTLTTNEGGKINGLGVIGAMPTIINESGLYSLILTSRKPQAKRFKKWVTSEVLPAIRKAGRYEASAPAELSASDQRLINRKAEDLSKKDFRRYQAALERRCRAALAAGLDVEEVLDDETHLLPAPAAPPATAVRWREGLACLYTDGHLVWFDTRDFFLPHGGEAMVLANYGKEAVENPLQVHKVDRFDALFTPFGMRTGVAAESVPFPGGMARLAHYVIGKIVSAP